MKTMMEFYSEQHVKSARKPHVCEMCGGTINVGDAYVRENGKWGGDFFSWCLHPHCSSMKAEYACETQEDEFVWEEILEYVSEVYCSKCPHALCNDYLPNHGEDCPYDSVTDCPIIVDKFTLKENKNEI